MTVMARYSGTCPECDETWQPGELIRADECEPGTLPTWKHAVCPDDVPERPVVVCPTCYLTKPCDCEDER